MPKSKKHTFKQSRQSRKTKHKERKTLNYVNLENSDSIDNQLKNLYKYYFKKEERNEDFLKCMKILMRNLIFPWAYFSVGPLSYCTEQKAILESEGGFCDRVELKKDNDSLPDHLEKLDLNEFRLFPPFLYAQIPTTGSKKFKKKKKSKRKRYSKRKKSTKKKSKRKKPKRTKSKRKKYSKQKKSTKNKSKRKKPKRTKSKNKKHN